MNPVQPVQNNNLAVVPAAAQATANHALQPKTGLSRVPAAVAGIVGQFLNIQERAQVHCVNKFHSQLIEKGFYGELDKVNKKLCREYLEEGRKLAPQLAPIELEISRLQLIVGDRGYAALAKFIKNNPLEGAKGFEKLQGKLYLLKAQRDELAPNRARYHAAMHNKKCTKTIVELFGGRKKFEALPVYEFQSYEKCSHETLDPSDKITHPIMRGEGSDGRTFLYIQAQQVDQMSRPLIPRQVVYCFQRSSQKEEWSGLSRSFLSGYLIDNGEIKPIFSKLEQLIKKGEVLFEAYNCLGTLAQFHWKLLPSKP